MTYEEMVKIGTGSSVYNVGILVKGHPITGGLELDSVSAHKFRTRKILRMSEIRELLDGINVKVVFKNQFTDEKFILDGLSFSITKEV